MQSIRFGTMILLGAVMAMTRHCWAGDLSGNWIAETSSPITAPELTYAHVVLKVVDGKVSGTWGARTLEGAVTGRNIALSLSNERGDPAGSLKGTIADAKISCAGRLTGIGRRMGGSDPAAVLQDVTFKLTPETTPPTKPRDIHYDPKTFFCYYSGANKPDLHIFPGDIVHTWTPDAGGVDSKGTRLVHGGDCSIGPIFIEGALPGDTLVVHLLKVRTNRTTARQGTRFYAATTSAYEAAAKYDSNFDGEYQLDSGRGIATLSHPSEHLKNYSVPIRPMLGCISVAPAGEESYRGTDLGPWGGNMDYNEFVEGATLYFPVSHPGALFGFGDGHAAMGDGEVTGGALETSMDVDFSVEVIRGYQTQQVRAENKDYIMSSGIAGSVADAIQVATSQLAMWIKKDYALSDSEVAVFLGAVMQYNITELVDPHYHVVAKVPKSALAQLN